MSQSINNMSVSWTDSGTTYNGIRLSVTDTASAAASNLLELRGGAAGTTSLFSVRKDGYATVSNLLGTLGVWAGATQGLFVRPDQARLTVGSNGRFSFSANTNAGSTEDTGLNLDAANTLAQRNGTNGQIFRVYGTYTDATIKFERFFIEAPSTPGAAVKLGTQKGTGATARALEFQTDGTTRLTIESTGKAVTAEGLDVGTSGALRTVNAGNYVVFGGVAALISASGLQLASSGVLGWSSTGSYSGGKDTGLARSAAGVVKVTNGSTGTGQLIFIVPTTDPGISGALWNNGGTLAISA